MVGKHKNLSERLLRSRRSGTVVVGDFIYDPGGTHGPRTQADYQLVFLFSGTAEIRVDGEMIVLSPGEMCLLLPGGRETFAFAPEHPTHHGWCSVRPGALPALPEKRLGEMRAARKAIISPRTGSLLELAFSIPDDAPLGLLESLACALFEEYLLASTTCPPTDPAKPPLPEAARRAREFIETRYAEPLDLARIGRAAGVAPKYLGKLFRRHLGVTPIRRLWQVRTERGAQLLTETGLSLGEIAERVGFQNPFHFSRLIRREFGVSPRQLRIERWNAGASASTKRGTPP